MFRVFISASSLERLCLNEMSLPPKEQSNWFVLLTKQSVIYLDKDIGHDWNCDDPLFLFSQSYQITLKDAPSDYKADFEKNPQDILKHPHDAFLLDIDKTKAEAIQSQYGVVCQSTKDLSYCAVSEKGCHFSLNKGEKTHSWADLFADKENIPANSIIIVDRYIFGFDVKTRSGYLDGVNNIKQILSNALPNSIGCDFHVLIIFDANKSKDDNFDLAVVASDLEDYKINVLKRPYPIEIELLAISSLCPRYEETHNRRVLSNYYIVSADHLLKVFRRNGEAIVSQNLNLDYSFSEGLRDRSDVPQKRINNLISKLQDLFYSARYAFQNGTSISSEYVYYSNGQLDTVDHLKNRLIIH